MTDMLTIIATNAVAVAIVGYLLRLWVDKRLAHALGQELERLKADLAKEVSRHSIQTTWNHSKRMELFSQLYEHMIDVDSELKFFLMNIKIGKKDFIQDRALNLSEKYLALNACLHKNELFLEQSLVDEVRSAYKPYVDMAQELLGVDCDIQQFQSSLPNKLEDICEVGDAPRKHVVSQFRRYAGLAS
ncbi:MAG: hypothetical protein NTW42_05750 [Deltaproteobacteria bacterium]|nr:hypothetical protein [Deltaproteobacteria bacterium]